MSKDYKRLWKDINTNDDYKAVRVLVEILADRDGRRFISDLGSKDVVLCIEILDSVSRNLHSFPAFAVLDGFVRASQSTTSRPSRNRPSSSC